MSPKLKNLWSSNSSDMCFIKSVFKSCHKHKFSYLPLNFCDSFYSFLKFHFIFHFYFSFAFYLKRISSGLLHNRSCLRLICKNVSHLRWISLTRHYSRNWSQSTSALFKNTLYFQLSNTFCSIHFEILKYVLSSFNFRPDLFEPFHFIPHCN